MAFPSIRSSTLTNGTTATTTPVVNLPATIRAGDTIVVIFKNAAAGAIGWPDATWIELVDASPDASVGQIGIAYKKADGTEGATITLSSASGKFASVAYAIQGATDPALRAPEISTVAIGTTGEPNATAVTPTGGAKDYLFLTTYLMEGEQTGVTAYPTNYTLGQQWANSGTAGAVTTNCTIGGAGRTANTTSEDAGVWDVTGTLDDSSAYTIALHPAEAVPAPLQTEFDRPIPAPLRSIGPAALTIALSLLSSTLAPVKPFAQTDWPIPPPRPSIIVSVDTIPDASTSPDRPFVSRAELPPPPWRPAPWTWTVNLLQSTLTPESRPTAQFDWPIPLRGRQLFLTASSRPDETSSSDAPFRGRVDGLPPAARPRTVSADSQNSLALAAGAVAADPFVGAVLEVPRQRPPSAATWLDGRKPYHEDEVPAHQTDWPVPLRARPIALSWLQGRQPFHVDETPAHQTDWPLPLRQRPIALTWTQTRQPLHVDEPTRFVTSWPNPAPRPAPAITWTQNLLQSTLAPIVPIQSTTLPLPPRALVPALTWIQSRPVFAVDQPTAFETAWPNPEPKPRPAQTWVVDHLLRTTIASLVPPPASGDWPLPRRATVPAITWTQTRPQHYVDQATRFTPTWPTPVGHRRPTPDVTSAPSLALLSAAQAAPVVVTVAALPVRPAIVTHTWTTSTLALEPRRPEGASSLDLPPPARRQPTLTWIGTIVVEPSRPEGAIETALPPARRVAPPQTWLQSPTILETAPLLIRQSEWPLPVRAIVPALTWVQPRPSWYVNVVIADAILVENETTRRLSVSAEATSQILETDAVSDLTLANEDTRGVSIANEAAVPGEVQ